MAVHRLCCPVASSHNLGTTAVFQIRQTWTQTSKALWQEKVEQSLLLRLLPQLGDDGWCLPVAILLQLCLEDRFRRYTFVLDPMVDAFDYIDGFGRQLLLYPDRDAFERRMIECAVRHCVLIQKKDSMRKKRPTFSLLQHAYDSCSWMPVVHYRRIV